MNLWGWLKLVEQGLLDISTAWYFYKVSKTILHKPTANSGINIFYNNVYINMIYNFYNKAYSVKKGHYKTRTFFLKTALFTKSWL